MATSLEFSKLYLRLDGVHTPPLSLSDRPHLVEEGGEQAGQEAAFFMVMLSGVEVASAKYLDFELRAGGPPLSPDYSVLGLGSFPMSCFPERKASTLVLLYSAKGLGRMGRLELELADVPPPQLGAAASQEGESEGSDSEESGSEPDGPGSSWVDLGRPPVSLELGNLAEHGAMRRGGGWGASSAEEAARLEGNVLEFKHAVPLPLVLLARCKLAFQARGGPQPDRLPWGGWRKVFPLHKTWPDFLKAEEHKLGLSADDVALTCLDKDVDVDGVSGDEATDMSVACDPIFIGRTLLIAGLAEKYDNLYQFVYGRGVGEVMQHVRPLWAGA